MSTQEEAIKAINSGENVVITGKAGCVDKDTEFLTPTGWKFISDYKEGDKVGQISEKGLEMSFCTPSQYIKDTCSEFNVIKSDRGVEQWLCDNHNVAYTVKNKNKLNKKPLRDIKTLHIKNPTGFTGYVPHVFNFQGINDYGLSEEYLRLGVALKADGSLAGASTGRYVIRLKRKDKIKRFRTILDNMAYEYKVKYEESTGYDIFTLYAKWCTKTLGQWMFCTKKEAEIILDEMQYWDASTSGNREPSFYTAKKEEADVIQYCATICGYKANIYTYDRRGQPYNDKYIRKSIEYIVSVSKQTHTNFLYKDTRDGRKKQELTRVSSKDGFKYCFTVPTGFLVMRRGGKIFITGNCGKSYIIKQVTDNKTVLTAPYGIAALNIDGETAASTFGVPSGIPTDEDLGKITPSFRALFESDYVKRIIIDEVGTLRADHLDFINHKLQKIKKNTLPFGGIQMILVGDFYQLPPIIPSEEKSVYRRLRYRSGWVFHSKVWKDADFKVVNLSKNYRQENQEHSEVLEAIRTKNDDVDWAIDKINSWCYNKESTDKGLYLCSYNKDVDRINGEYYKASKEKAKIYKATIKDRFNMSDANVKKEVKLKIGLAVVICANCKEKTYRNGELGTILKMHKDYVVVKKQDGEIVSVVNHTWKTHKTKLGVGGVTRQEIGSMSQIPLRLGYALTIHKAQGMTLDSLYIDFGKLVRSSGLAYVSLSRGRDMTKVGLKRKLTIDDILIDKHVENFYRGLEYEG